jgi:hypothetical protein
MLEILPHGILVWDEIFSISNSEVPANHVRKSTTIHTHPLGRKRRGILPFLLRNNTASFSLSLCLSLCGLGGYGYFLARRGGHIMQLEWNQRLIQMQTELEFGIWDATRFQIPNPLIEWLKSEKWSWSSAWRQFLNFAGLGLVGQTCYTCCRIWTPKGPLLRMWLRISLTTRARWPGCRGDEMMRVRDMRGRWMQDFFSYSEPWLTWKGTSLWDAWHELLVIFFFFFFFFFLFTLQIPCCSSTWPSASLNPLLVC